MTDFPMLDRAKAVQAKAASEALVTIKLDLLEGLIAEIEALRSSARTPVKLGSIRDINARHQLKDDPS